MNRRTVISALSLAPFAHAATSTAAERKKFIGMWKMVSGESKDQVTGEVLYPWGKHPFGRLLYDERGRVFVQLMNPGRRSVGGMFDRGAAAAIASSSAEDMRDMLTGFNAYFGTFDVDQAAGIVIHHLQSALIPSWVGSDQRRRYEFSAAGELIILNAASRADYRLVFQRDDT
jgi:Lipocalin-like domain